MLRLYIKYIVFLAVLPVAGCITPFNPDITEKNNLLVVEGMITNQNSAYTINLEKALPAGTDQVRLPVSGATVIVVDDQSNTYYFHETSSGVYKSDSTLFTGVLGRKYTLMVKTNFTDATNYNYKSYPVELKPVPSIDSVYYEKVTTGINEFHKPVEGCQIYLNTHDNGEDCKYYRWNYSETWEFQLHWDVANRTCWRTESSNVIQLKNTSYLAENKIEKMPLLFVDNATDRLSTEYSILVSQYSISQDEYEYWDKVKNITQNVGSLYDIVPSSISGNVFCVEDPSRPVLGYFSVSGVSTKRMFTHDFFSGQQNFYSQCIGDTIFYPGPISGLGQYVWILLTVSTPGHSYRIITYTKSCADCTTRGVLAKPDFWDDKKSVTR
jgi:hypothetical protein